MPNGVPYFYDYANGIDSWYSPSEIHLTDNKVVMYYARYLMQKAMSPFKWEIPDWWAENYFLYSLYEYGFVAIVNTDKFGVIPQACSLRGYDVFYQPTNAVIANPLLRGTREPRIGTECVLLRLQPNYSGICDLVRYHAVLMGLAYETLTTNLLNSKLAYVGFAENKAQAETLKKLYDQIASGVPAVVTGRSRKTADIADKPLFDLFQQNLGANFIAPDLLTVMRAIERNFDREIGIPVHPFETRKERPITAEMTIGNFETESRVSLWLQTLQDDCKKARDMFGIGISVDWRVDRAGNVIDSRLDSLGRYRSMGFADAPNRD